MKNWQLVENQQLIISGVGGQGVLFITRLLAEAAIAGGLPVLSSETHGMAQRGGIVVSHLKVGGFAGPRRRARAAARRAPSPRPGRWSAAAPPPPA